MAFCPACQQDYPDGYNRCPQDGTTLLSGRKVGKYQITARIGEGGMGAVYRAVNPDTRAEVAIKLLHAKAAASSSIRARFQREAEAVAALRTRHVIRIFDFGSDGETLYLVMELLEGENLRELLKRGGAMSLPRAATILDGALRGLAAAHRAGVTHRDLKPENIYLTTTDDGEVVKVLDFGIARVADTTLTDTGALIGTPAYMAPEQVASSFGQVGPRTDIFAMGVIAYEMLTGVSPFLDGNEGTSSVNEILGRVVEGTFEPLAKLRPDLPPAVVDLIERAMSDAPDRQENADAMRAALAASVSGVADLPPMSGPHMAATSSAATQRTDLSGEASAPTLAQSGRSRRLSFALAGLAVAVGGIATIIAMRGGDDPTPTPAVVDASSGRAVSPPSLTPDAALEARVQPPPADMVRFEGGTFEMGTAKYSDYPDALPPRTVEVAGFWLDVYEAHGDDDKPLFDVTFEMAKSHCEKLGKRLPTEAEWEFAARRGQPTDGRMRGNKKLAGPAPVGTSKPDKTSDGVFDLLGNLSEWTATAWVDGKGSGDPALRTVRGASYNVKRGAKFFSTIFARYSGSMDKTSAEIGFRCATNDPPPEGVK